MTNGTRWDFPGGRIEENEIPVDAAQLKIREQVLSIGNFTVGRILDSYSLPTKDHEIDALYNVTFFEVNAEPFEVQLSEEYTDFRWVNKDTLGELLNTPDVLIEPNFFRALQKCLSNPSLNR